ncbi:nucleoside hydrolase [Winslowiella iniecta]|uniref:Nucleoside hydrolase n=1 Tax=Winslowiella iniecta TaxID=1560201 RepID=A0A0L7TI00_9GAMM|nr:nucleoside hydrolase [Winslowiella iniecta]KOC94866.1 nucleoside hydrolase [Winslowiella iniecta]
MPFTPDHAKQLRVMISSDAKNEADDDFAIAHALLTPTFEVRGLIASHYSRTAAMLGNTLPTMEESYKELARLKKVMGDSPTPLYRGARQPLGAADQPLSEGAKAIITEAQRDDKRPLYVLILGPATDIALALQAAPDIADKLTVVWIGGNPYPQGGWEYNLFNDPQAGNVLFQSAVPLWQVPHNVYMSMRVSLAELAVKVKPQGETGHYLWQQMIDFNRRASATIKDIPWPKSEVWVLGDNPAVGLLLDDHQYHYQEISAPTVNEDLTYGKGTQPRKVRVYQSIDAHFVLEDFFAKLQLAYGQ